jgi:hypothetical protein
MHVFNDKGSNDANVNWIVRLREYPSSKLSDPLYIEGDDDNNANSSLKRDPSKSRVTE